MRVLSTARWTGRVPVAGEDLIEPRVTEMESPRGESVTSYSVHASHRSYGGASDHPQLTREPRLCRFLLGSRVMRHQRNDDGGSVEFQQIPRTVHSVKASAFRGIGGVKSSRARNWVFVGSSSRREFRSPKHRRPVRGSVWLTVLRCIAARQSSATCRAIRSHADPSCAAPERMRMR